MLIFWSEEHVNKWCTDWNLPRGEIISLDQCWKLAHAWYSADRRLPDWRRKTPDEINELFHNLGFTTPFWKLS